MKWLYWIFCCFFLIGYGVSSGSFNDFPEKKGKQILFGVSLTLASPVMTPLIMGYELGDYRHRLDSLATVQNCDISEENIEQNVNFE